MTSMMDDYFKNVQLYEQKYGKNCVVLYMVGSFYEAYGLEQGHDKVTGEHCNCLHKIGNIERISKILGIQLTKRNKPNQLTYENPYLCGFPSYALPKHLAKLLATQHTVAIFEQFDSDDPRYSKERRLTNIYSPSTYIDDENFETNNILLCCYLYSFICPITKSSRMNAAVSYIDLSTGKVHCCEYMDDQDHPTHVKQELCKLFYHIDPCEIVFIESKSDELFIKSLIQEVSNGSMCHIIPYNKSYDDNVFQEEFIKKLYHKSFPKTKISSWKEIIGLNNSGEMCMTFIQLLQFAYDHDPHIIEKIAKPIIEHSIDGLYLNQDAIYNLNLLSEKHNILFNDSASQSSCFSIINKTNTKMGERLLKYRLTHPVTSIDELTKRYNMIDTAKPHYRQYSELLKDIVDIDKKYRKMVLGRLSTCEFAQLHKTFCSVLNIFDANNNLFNITNCKNIKKLIEYTTKRFNINAMLDIHQTRVSFFNTGIDNIIDELNSKITELESIFKKFEESIKVFGNDNAIRASLNVMIDKQGNCIISTTKRAYENIKSLSWSYSIRYSKSPKPLIFKLSDLTVENVSQNAIKLRSKLLDKLANTLEKSKQQLEIRCKQLYEIMIKQYVEQYNDLIHNISHNVAIIDIAVSSAICSIENYYTRPILSNSEHGSFNIIGLRHPIIEKISDTTEYITNDVNLDNKNIGMLLYGLNSSGKSSLLRAIGINIILAQAGFYCSCDSINLSPYCSLFTKISSNDNLFKGQSTFVVEMYCLRDILQQSNKKTLVLCDELTAGTENNSAIGIVASSIITLIKQSTNFIFTTHLHGLMNFDELASNSKLSIFHFAVSVHNNEIIQNRKLITGSGDDKYGIEIASALGLSKQFTKLAYEYRHKFTGEETQLLTNKRSRYNSKVIVDCCTHCGYRPPKDSTNHLHVHHIAHQANTDERGRINGKAFHKNIKHNLMVLCETCHHKVHHDDHDGIDQPGD